ncbi:MAG: DNA polymerase III subunit epsilon [Chakrabartia godavariana]
MREVVFDTETTGLSAANGDRMVEIGCVELVNRVETGRVFHAYINPERPMNPEAQAVHGLSDAFLADKPLFSDIVEDLLDFFDESPLVAHNANFDFAFLNEELSRLNRPDIAQARMIDTLALSKVKFPGAKHSLDALCTRFGIDRSHRIKHGALLDAQLLSLVYVELTGGRQIGLGLADAPATLASEPERTMTAARVARPPRPHDATPEELARHAAFIAKLNDPLWTLDKEGEGLAAA